MIWPIIVENKYLPADAIFWIGRPRRANETIEEWRLHCGVIHNVKPPDAEKESEKENQTK